MTLSSGASLMEIDNDQLKQVGGGGEEDPFLAFIEYARSVLFPQGDDDDPEGNEAGNTRPGWSWIASRILKTCISYSSGVTAAILLSDLSLAWSEQHRAGAPRKRPEIINQLKRKHRRTKLPNTVTIDSIYEKNFLSLSSVLEAVIVDAFVLPGTNIYMLTLGDCWSSNTIDLYLHRRYYDLVDAPHGILKKAREVFVTGCYLRSAREGSGSPRLLPTEYLVILLDEDLDDDAILIGAQFCSDSFSSISLAAIKNGVSYSLYARIESIGPLEIQGSCGSLQRKQITLVDNDGVKLKFFLWNEQVILANLFSVGSMLALDRPYIASSAETGIETSDDFFLEYGTATQLYLVPFVQHEEQVCLSSQNLHQGSTLHVAVDPTQGPRVSQVILPCDSLGSIDFRNYPLQSFVVDLHDKMTGISLYGVVTDIFRETNTEEVIFSLKIEDVTGTIWAKLHFFQYWSLGRVSVGHMVFISGLTCSKTKQNRLEVSWFEKDVGAYFVNLSCLSAILNSSCLHKLSKLSHLSSWRNCMHISRVWLDQVDRCHVTTRFSHATCGHFVKELPGGAVECSFCRCHCHGDTEISRVFYLKIILADESTKIFAWCTGQTATELLQISPDEFNELSEDEQVMYHSSLENGPFMVTLVNCKRQGYRTCDSLTLDANAVSWEITRALKREEGAS